jgi:hypothetical protein
MMLFTVVKKAAPAAPWPTECPFINDVVSAVITWLVG